MLNRVLGLLTVVLGLAFAAGAHAATGVALDGTNLQNDCVHPGQVELPGSK